MNNDPLPPATAAGALGELLKSLSDKDGWAQKLTEQETAQKKTVDLIKELEAKEKAFNEQVAQHEAKVAVVSAALAKDVAALEKDKAELINRESKLASKIAEHKDAVNSHKDDVADLNAEIDARKASLDARETAIVETEKQAQAALDDASKKNADADRRIELIKQAQA